MKRSTKCLTEYLKLYISHNNCDERLFIIQTSMKVRNSRHTSSFSSTLLERPLPMRFLQELRTKLRIYETSAKLPWSLQNLL